MIDIKYKTYNKQSHVNNKLPRESYRDTRFHLLSSNRRRTTKNKMAPSITRYGVLLNRMISPDSDLPTSVSTFEELYMADKELDTYSDKENIVLSDFYFECDAFEPDGSDVWATKFKDTYVDSSTIRQKAMETLNKLQAESKG